MEKAVFFVLLGALFASPSFLDNSSRSSSSPSAMTAPFAPASSAPDCRIQTC